MKKFTLLFLCLVLSACQSAPKGSDQSLYNWQITAVDSQIKSRLSTESTITHYDGSSEKVTVTQDAESGNVYVLIELTIKKAKSKGTPFSWEKLTLNDTKGNTYTRIEDGFLVKHTFERLTPLEIRLGDHRGWIAFEIPEANAKTGLTLVYQADEGENKVIINP